MRRTLQGTILIVAAVALGFRATDATAACETPLVISTGSSDANVLIILDNSMSMNQAMVSSAYNPATTYTGSFNSGSTYNVSRTGTYTPSSFNSKWAATPSATLVTSDLGQSAQYDGNYLNWVFFNATTAQRAAIPTVTRIQAAKQAVNTVFASSTNCRFGLMDFNNGSSGGHLVAPMGTSVAALQTALTTIAATEMTPLARTLDSALVYYQSTGANAPIVAACEKSFIVLVTDGEPTNDSPVPAFLQNYSGVAKPACPKGNKGGGLPITCPDYVMDISAYLYRNDMRADFAGIQNVSTYVIGCNVDSWILQSTADNGGGEYFTVNDVSGLGAAVQATFASISKRVAAGAAVAVVSSENRNNNRLYRARYETQTWQGFVEAFPLPYHAGAQPLWEAGSLLSQRSSSSRVIYTSIDGATATAFTSSNAPYLMASLGAADLTTAGNIIEYARGTAVAGTRDRAGWVLGDVIDASPIVVGAPSLYSSLPGYGAFRTAYLSRPEMLYVGANDGMLHCFSTADGSEQWAYVPRDVLPRLGDLMSTSYCHEYYVNLTPAAYDVYTGGAWKTILVGGEERGGNGLFALNVTDPAHPALLWDLSLTALRGSWNTPTLVRDRTRNAQVFCVGTGYEPTLATAGLLVMDPGTGTVLTSFNLGSAFAGNKTTRATSIDLNFDGYDDLLYLGDLSGRIWRVDMRTNPWTISVLINCGQPIQAAPTVTVNALGQPMLFFGTGEYLNASDVTNTAQQTLYGVVDDGTGTTVTTDQLADQTTTFHALTGAQKGWKINLMQGSGERIVRQGALINGALYVPSFQPDAVACEGGGQSWIYSVDFKDGSAPDNAAGVANNVTTGRVSSMGDGLISDPSVDLVNGNLVLQSSNAVVMTHNIVGGLKRLLVRSWRQTWN
jgi:type IV pilus assembly protein PilY1